MAKGYGFGSKKASTANYNKNNNNNNKNNNNKNHIERQLNDYQRSYYGDLPRLTEEDKHYHLARTRFEQQYSYDYELESRNYRTYSHEREVSSQQNFQTTNTGRGSVFNRYRNRNYNSQSNRNRSNVQRPMSIYIPPVKKPVEKVPRPDLDSDEAFPTFSKDYTSSTDRRKFIFKNSPNKDSNDSYRKIFALTKDLSNLQIDKLSNVYETSDTENNERFGYKDSPDQVQDDYKLSDIEFEKMLKRSKYHSSGKMPKKFGYF